MEVLSIYSQTSHKRNRVFLSLPHYVLRIAGKQCYFTYNLKSISTVLLTLMPSKQVMWFWHVMKCIYLTEDSVCLFIYVCIYLLLIMGIQRYILCTHLHSVKFQGALPGLQTKLNRTVCIYLGWIGSVHMQSICPVFSKRHRGPLGP